MRVSNRGLNQLGPPRRAPDAPPYVDRRWKYRHKTAEELAVMNMRFHKKFPQAQAYHDIHEAMRGHRYSRKKVTLP